MPTEGVDIGRQVHELRRRALLSQEQLAELAGIGVRTIRDLERGRVGHPHPGTLRQLAKALGVPPEKLAFFRPAPVGHIPQQLPPDIPDFVGRTTIIERLCAFLSQPGPLVVGAITGLPGIGKTALAVHVAHLLRDRFPDGQLYVDLRGVDASPLDPAEILDRFLRALDIDGSAIPDTLDERAALYRSTLAQRQILVLLDNAANEAQVRPLLVSAPNCVLVTSRTRLTARAVHPDCRPRFCCGR